MAQRNNIARATTRIYSNALMRHKKDLFLSFLQPAGWVFMIVLVPFFASKAIADISLQNGQFERNLLMLALVSIAGVICNRIGFNAFMATIAKVMNDLHEMAFTKLLQRGLKFHANTIGGKLVSDALDFVGAFSMLYNTILGIGFSLSSTLIVGLIIITIQSWQLGLFIFLMVAITVVWAYLESRTRYALRTRRLAATKRVTSHLSDSIVNAQTVKTFGHESYELDINRNYSQILKDMRITDWQRAGRSGNDRIGFLLLMLILLLVLISRLAADNTALIGIGIFAFTYTLNLIIRLFDINTITRQIEEAYLQASPMTTILLEDNEITDSPDATDLTVSKGAISFNDVTFYYQEGAHSQGIFKNLSFDIAAGERVGIVGPSGGGKTTLSRLLLRFEDIQSGAILIDDNDIRNVSQSSLRKSIAYVPQEPLLFHRSIKDNIQYGNPAANEAAILQAAQLAHATEFIDTMPRRYDTIVGERGVKLSGGQRQRIAIARAILKNAPILVLDEATSALDSESENHIQEALWQLMQNRTAIVIAHRLSTIQKMDRIIVLDKGKIIESGTHPELLKRGGLYAKLWARQSGGFIDN